MEVTWTTLLIVCPLVFLSGLVDAVAGGGGLISLPAYLLAGLPPHAATATNKCGSVFGTGLSTLRFLKNGRVRLGPAAVCSLLGHYVGSGLALKRGPRPSGLCSSWCWTCCCAKPPWNSPADSS